MPQENTCVTNGGLPPTDYTENLNSRVLYPIGFDRLKNADVVVYWYETDTSTPVLLTNSAAQGATPPNYTITGSVEEGEVITGGNVKFADNEAPGGAKLVIGRRTEICDTVVDYQVGASITAEDLNASNEQLLGLIQENRSSLSAIINGNNTDPIIPGEGVSLGDLTDVNLADPVPNPSLIRFNGTEWVNNNVLESGDAWDSNNSTFATTAAGDDRWLQTGPGGNINGGDGIEIDTSVGGEVTINVDIADTDPGLQFDGDDKLQVIGNSITESSPGVETDPTLTNGPSGVVLKGGSNITVTRVNNGEVVIAVPGGIGGLTFRGTVDVSDNATIPDSAAVNDAWTESVTASMTPEWNALINGTASTVNSGDILVCVTAGDNLTARYEVIQTGGVNSLQQVTNVGNTTTNDIILDGSDLKLNSNSNQYTIKADDALSGDFTATFPDKSGTVAMTSDITPNTNTTYTLPVTGDATQGTLTLTGSDGSTDAVTITAGNNLDISNLSADGFTLDASGGDVAVQDDGVEVEAAASTFNFTGSGVTVTGSGGTATIDIPGGGGGGGGGSVTPADVYGTAKAYCTLDFTALAANGQPSSMNGVSNSRNIIGAGKNIAAGPVNGFYVDFEQGTFQTASAITGLSVATYAPGTGQGTIAFNDDRFPATTVDRMYFTVAFTAGQATNNYPEEIRIDFFDDQPASALLYTESNVIKYDGAAAWGAIAQNGDLEGTPLNVDEVIFNGTGDYTVKFDTPMPNVNYSVVATPRTGGTRFIGVNNKTVNGFDIVTYNDSNIATSSPFSFVVQALNAIPPKGTTGTDAWGNVNDDGTINASYNITSVTRTGAGEYEVEFTTAMPSANYSVQTTCISTGTRDSCAHTFTTTGFTVNTYSASGAQQDVPFTFSVNATNANLPATITQEQLDAIYSGIGFEGITAWANTTFANNNVATTPIPILNSMNIKSIVIGQGGVVNVEFNTPMPNANYAVIGTCQHPTLPFNFTVDETVGSKTVNGFGYRINQIQSGTSTPNAAVAFAVVSQNSAPPQGTTGTDSWGSFNQNAVMAASYNAKVTKAAAGTYDVEFNTPMPDNTYSINCTASLGAAAWSLKTADGFRIITFNTATGVGGDFAGADFQVNATNANLPVTITQDQIEALARNPAVSAWGNITAANTMVGNFNCSISTANNIHTITFDTPMTNDKYSVVGSLANNVNNETVRTLSQTAQSFQILAATSAGVVSATPINFQVIGATRNAAPLGGGADAWGDVQADGTLDNGFGCTITKGGNGAYTVNLVPPMPNANYAITMAGEYSSGQPTNKTANGFNVNTTGSGGASNRAWSFAVFATDGNAGGYWTSNGTGANEVIATFNDQATVEAAALTDGVTTRTMTEVLDNTAPATTGDILQQRALTVTMISSALSSTAWTNIQTNTITFTPKSTNSTVIVDYVFEARQNNLASTNIQVNYRNQYGGLNSNAFRQSIFSNAGGDGGVFPVQIRWVYSNIDTNNKDVMLQGQMNQAAGSATFDQCTLVITEIQN